MPDEPPPLFSERPVERPVPPAAPAAGVRSGRAAARDSVHGLALGDAFGERWFPLMRSPAEALREIRERRVPRERSWHWTDDTAMALAVLSALRADGEIVPDRLARLFAETYEADPGRGYGPGMHVLLPELAKDPASWRTRAAALFGGEGSLGNGAAMRSAPVGAWFHADLERAAAQAAAAAGVTHGHPEGIAGAVAVAVAAGLAARYGTGRAGVPSGPGFLHEVAGRTPPGRVRQGLLRAARIPGNVPPARAAEELGNGARVRADDTVPFAVWGAAHHLESLVDALWAVAEGLGDVDTTCAITGGIVASGTGLGGVPEAWLARREPLPGWVDAAGGG